jgi:hypothetical protein
VIACTRLPSGAIKIGSSVEDGRARNVAMKTRDDASQ